MQYRTANDDKVREEHAALHGTTLPVDDPFWDKYFPPLGWNCRCTAVQVRKDKYPVSDSTTAIQAGERATNSPKKQIFRFNPGKEGKIFPPKHPYYKTSAEAKKTIENIARYEQNKALYNRLKEDENYFDVEFDEKSGGVKATHVGHNIHDSDNVQTFFNGMKPADLERECQNLLFKWGHTTILRDEFHNNRQGNTLPSLDIEIDGKIMDIRSITSGQVYGYALFAKNSQLGNVKKKTGIISDCVCLHFHDASMFSEEKLFRDAEWFKNKTTEVETTQRIKHIYVVVNGDDQLRIYDI